MKHKSILFIFASLFLIAVISLTSAVCCEQTIDSAVCQDVSDVTNCDTDFNIEENTACATTSFCSVGTCVDRNTGDCIESPQASCDTELGGYWYDKPVDEVAECSLGCCIIGDGASFIERVTCDTMGSDYDVIPTFRADITDPDACFALAGQEKKGACVFQSELGRDCDISTRGECQDTAGEFHEDFLCTNPELGTICAMTKRTTCIEGKNEVYFVDSCENKANIYDANKVENIDYWTYIKDVSDSSETCGVGLSNKESAECGNCNYILGSTCGEGTADYGDYFCKDMGCIDGSLADKFASANNGVYPNHADAWCSNSMGTPVDISYFEGAVPGQTSHLLYCYDGKVYDEQRGNFRNNLCSVNTTSGEANWIVNRWEDCFAQNSSDDCLNEDVRDCKFVEGNSYLADEFGSQLKLENAEEDEVRAACVPKYTPAFNFWEPSEEISGLGAGAQEICQSQSSSICTGYYTKQVGGTWISWEPESWDKYSDNIQNTFNDNDLYGKGVKSICFQSGESDNDKLPSKVSFQDNWVEGRKNLCLASGDCGIKQNYLGEVGYGDWKDMFDGNIKKDNI